MPKPMLLIAEDEEIQREALREHLQEEEYEVITATTVQKAIDITSYKTIDAIINTIGTSIAVDSADNVHISYNANSNLKYITNASGVWTS